MEAQVADDPLQGVVFQIAVAAVQLQGLIGDLEAGVGGEALGHGAKAGGGRIAGVERGGGAAHHQPRGLQLGGHVGELELQRLEILQRPTELAALGEVGLGGFQRQAGAAEGTGGDVEPAAVEPHHGDAEPLALFADPIGRADPDIVEMDHGRRLTAPAHLALLRSEAEARRILLHHQGRNPGRALSARQRHDHIEVRRSSAGNEGLGAVQHIGVAVAPRAGRQRGRVRAGAWFGQAIGGDQVHAAQRRQKAPAQLVRAEPVDHPGGHVVDRQEGGGGDIACRQRLEDDRRIQP